MPDLFGLEDSASLDDGIFDVVTKDYAHTILQFYPNGRAWIIKLKGVFDNLLCAWSFEPSRVERRGRDLISESDPLKTQELLEDWERVLGLPGDCEEPPSTLEGRQSAVHAKLTQKSFSSITFFLRLADRLGYPFAIIRNEHKPFQCGISVCGDALQGHHGHWTYTWTLITNDTTENDATLRCLVREAAQAHAIVHFEFPGQETIVEAPL
jgi:uncharacterized protein YmfQ (DUF2313 family)